MLSSSIVYKPINAIITWSLRQGVQIRKQSDAENQQQTRSLKKKLRIYRQLNFQQEKGPKKKCSCV